jgi:hypothetical protein
VTSFFNPNNRLLLGTNYVLAVRGPKPTAANASATETQAIVGEAATLDGSLSTDPYDEDLTYSWELGSKPATSALALGTSVVVGNNGTNPAGASFTPDVVGDYGLILVVSARGTTLSAAPATVIVTANTRPTATITTTSPTTVDVGDAITLNGTTSTVGSAGGALTYMWSASLPGSFTPSTTASAVSFTPTCSGPLTLSLIVNDGTHDSDAGKVDITVTGSVSCGNLDVDGDNEVNPLGDGLLILRYMFEFTADELDVGGNLINPAGSRNTPQGVIDYLDAMRNGGLLDVDGDTENNPLGDGLLILRYMFEFTADELDVGGNLINPAGSRNTSQEVIDYLDTINPLK